MLLRYILMMLRGTNPFIIMNAKRLFEKYNYEIKLDDLEAHYLASGGRPSFDKFMTAAQIVFERKEIMDFKKLCALHLAGYTDEIIDGKTLAEIIEEVGKKDGSLFSIS